MGDGGVDVDDGVVGVIEDDLNVGLLGRVGVRQFGAGGAAGTSGDANELGSETVVTTEDGLALGLLATVCMVGIEGHMGVADAAKGVGDNSLWKGSERTEDRVESGDNKFALSGIRFFFFFFVGLFGFFLLFLLSFREQFPT